MSDLLTYLLNNDPQFRKARLAALYSDFLPQRTLNPDGYAANIAAWRHGLASAARAGAVPCRGGAGPDRLSLTIDSELLRALETKEWGRPLALAMVVKEATDAREWIHEKQFRESEESVYKRKGWRVPGIGEVFGWGLRQLGVLGNGDGDFSAGKVMMVVVVLENLEEAGREVERRIEMGAKGRVDRIYTKSAFVEEFGDVLGADKKLSEGDTKLLLKFLSRDKGLLAYDGETIKIKPPGEKSMGEITMEDATIASLKTLIIDLELQTTVLTRRVDELGITAKQAVARKNRVVALAILKSKKLAEITLTKRHATLAQLEEVLSKIEQAADQVELIRVMEGSAKVLSGLNKEAGGLERVDDVVDQLREQMSQVDEVGNVVAQLGQEAGNMDEGEVDEELETMEKEDREKREAKERADREEMEKKEAVETRRRLDALEEVERQVKEAAAKKAAVEQSNVEKILNKSTEELKMMSLDPNPTQEAV